MWDVLLDALIDSLKVFGAALVIYFIVSFFENKIVKLLEKKSKASPLFGAAFGLVPQCGIGVVAGDLYVKHHVTMGTIIALFLACSDEALPIMLSSPEGLKTILPLIAIKFVVGFVVGFVVDMFEKKERRVVSVHIEHCDHNFDNDVHIGCCGHQIEEEKTESFFRKHLLHPLKHSLKIFLYVLVMNVILGTLLYFLKGEEFLTNLLASSKWTAPAISILVGMIPNCAASVVITTLFIEGGISFGACVAGLLMNAGLGLLFLFKEKNAIKSNLKIVLIMTITSLVVGYGIELITTFLIK